MASIDLIEDARLQDGTRTADTEGELIELVPEPIRISGVGHLTLFGLTNKFNTEFPSGLTAKSEDGSRKDRNVTKIISFILCLKILIHVICKLAPEEFSATLSRINKVLGRTLPLNLRWLLCGCICCCCTMGLSMWPVIYLSKRTRHSLEKIIDSENCNLYHKLGLHWKLQKQMVHSSNTMEYVLLVEFRPKLAILKPD